MKHQIFPTNFWDGESFQPTFSSPFVLFFSPWEIHESARACFKAMAWSLSLAERRRLRGVPRLLMVGNTFEQ